MSKEIRTVGFVGLGVMGNPMAGHLMAGGKRLLVNTRSPQKAQTLLASGAEWRASPAELAPDCDAIITMVGYPTDVENVYFGPKGLIAHCKPGTILIDMSTSRPDLAVRIAEAAGAAGCLALDAPVSGGDLGARSATLTIMVGGPQAAYDAALPLFQLMGKTIVRQGGPGAGQHTKMANQIAIAGSLTGTVESLTYARSAGLDPSTVLLSISSGSAGSWQLSNLGPRMLKADFAPGFYVKHFLKDLRIALDAAKSMKLHLPMLELAESLFTRVSNEGMDDLGTQALYCLYEKGLA